MLIVIPKDEIKIEVNYDFNEVQKLYNYYLLNFDKFNKYNYKLDYLNPLNIKNHNNELLNINNFNQNNSFFNPFLADINDDIKALGKDIYFRGMYNPIIITDKKNKTYCVEGRHRLMSLQYCIKNKLIPYYYKIITLKVPKEIDDMINSKNNPVPSNKLYIKEKLYFPTILLKYYPRYKQIEQINELISLIEVKEELELFFIQSLFFNFLMPLLYNYNIEPYYK